MSSDRLAEATDLRARGEARKTQMVAEAEPRLYRAGRRCPPQSEIIRGQGDAERNKVFAQAFEKDPEFFTF